MVNSHADMWCRARRNRDWPKPAAALPARDRRRGRRCRIAKWRMHAMRVLRPALRRGRVYSGRPFDPPFSLFPSVPASLAWSSLRRISENRSGTPWLTTSLYMAWSYCPILALMWPDHVPVPAFGPRMVCTRCGIIGADAIVNDRDHLESAHTGISLMVAQRAYASATARQIGPRAGIGNSYIGLYCATTSRDEFQAFRMPVRLSANGALNRRCVALSCSRFCLGSI
jgi:hypothetical protein